MPAEHLTRNCPFWTRAVVKCRAICYNGMDLGAGFYLHLILPTIGEDKHAANAE